MASSFQKAILSDINRSENPQAGHATAKKKYLRF
jgi:hypothetical protein